MSNVITLEKQIEQVGSTKADIARYFQVRPNTVTEWCKNEPPRAVSLHLESLIYYREQLRRLRNV